MILTDFVEDTFAFKKGLVLRQMHIVVVAERTIHDSERVEHHGGERQGLGIDEPHGARRLQSETDLVGKSHGEIIGNTRIGKALHLVDGATKEVAPMVSPVGNGVGECGIHTCFRKVAIVTGVQPEQGSAVVQQIDNMLIITSVQIVLRIVEPASVGVFDEIDTCSVCNPFILRHNPRECVGGVVQQIAPCCSHLLALSAQDTAYSPTQMTKMRDGVHIMGEVDVAVTRFGKGEFQQFHQETCVLVHDRDEKSVVLVQTRTTRRETSVFIAVVSEQFFCA